MGLYLRGRIWWMRYISDGQEIRESTKTTQRRLAERALASRKGDIVQGRFNLQTLKPGPLLRDFIEVHYWPRVASILSPIERRNRRNRLDLHILPRFGSHSLGQLHQEAIEAWYAERLGAVAVNTATRELGLLKHILNRAVEWGYLTVSPAQKVKPRRSPPGRVRYLTDEERSTLLAGCDGRLYPVVLTALHTGARRGELLALRWKDMDFKARTLTFWHTKNGEQKSIPMTETLANCLRALPRALDPETRVFAEWTPDALSVAFGRLIKRLGLRDLCFHDLRHDYASSLTMGGVTQRAVMMLLGHKDPRMTLRYQHLSPEYLKEAVRVLDHRAKTATRTISAQ